jgi:cytochrome c-type biogenesis protein
MQEQISILLTFLAGIGSFFSPCILPLIPVYLSFITGLSVNELKSTEESSKDTRKVLKEVILFIIGFSIVFVALGASASSITTLLVKSKKILRIIGGIIIIIFGLHITGLLKIKFLEYEKKIHLETKPILGGLGSLVVGMTFAIGWTPCIGPILGAILTLAATRTTLLQGVILLSVYSLGLSLPFLITGLAVNQVLKLFTKIKKYLKIITIATGIMLIITGILVLSGRIL